MILLDPHWFRVIALLKNHKESSDLWKKRNTKQNRNNKVYSSVKSSDSKMNISKPSMIVWNKN